MALIKNSMSKTIARDALVLDLADVRVQADLIVDRARKQAEAMIEAGRAEREKLVTGAAELGRKEGFAKGHAEGHAAGLKQGAEAGQKEQKARLEELQGAWQKALEAFVSAREGLLLDAKSSLLRLALCIAERVIKQAIIADPGVVLGQVEAVLELVLRPSRLRVAVNPADQATVEAAWPALAARFRHAAHVELGADAAVPRGSCRVAITPEVAGSEHGGWGAVTEVDATLGTQLDRIAQVLVPGTTSEAA